MKEQVQDPDWQAIVKLLTFASLMGHKSNLVDTCKSSRVLVVSPIATFMLYIVVFLVSTDYVNTF